jgi:hypothetical protein
VVDPVDLAERIAISLLSALHETRDPVERDEIPRRILPIGYRAGDVRWRVGGRAGDPGVIDHRPRVIGFPRGALQPPP